ncbi:MAG: glycosyltransferase [Aeromicrobium sp.]|nr:glycosyltransferase [Aeromicrobium sp.]
MTTPTILVVAKAPVPGFAKTRIAETIGDDAAAGLAAAALLDTLATVSAIGWPTVVAMTGDLTAATRSDEIATALEPLRVVEQRGDSFAARLAHAHVDAGAEHGIVQVGMDTPQATVRDYLDAGHLVGEGKRVLGPAEDGGWWLLGLPDPADATALADVPMSQDDTGVLTEQALGGGLLRVRALRDMDSLDDARVIAETIPISHLAVALDTVEVTP